MRLINAETLKLEEFTDKNIPPYVILSHTWGPAGSEITFQDIQSLSPEMKDRQGYAKITNCCTQALRHGFDWAWVDTCCIDKSSSAELSESINSMFSYYKKAESCYAYLADVDSAIRALWPLEHDAKPNGFEKSKWFTRGWTLQELLAPKFVEFYSRSWRFIGTKATLSPLISRITRIPEKILQGGYLSSLSIATRMSWAADRVTTRVEDIAYSLLGIFDTHMPLLYGEGERAFARLQEEIMKESDDQSIFAWDFHPVSKQPLEPTSGLLAESPAAFAKSANVVPFRNAKESEPYSLTNKGIRMKLILLPYEKLPASTTLVTAVLECRSDGPFQGPLGITLIRFDHFTRSDQYTRLLTESDNPKPIPLDKILGQNATNVFITKNTFAPQVDMGGGFVIHVNAESSYILTQAYPADCWNQAASIMGTGPQDVGVLIFERPGDKHFAILLRARARNSAPLDLCKSFRDRESLRQALKPYYGVYEHLKITCAQKTDGPLKEGEMVLDSFNPLAGRANVFSGLMDRSPEGRVSYRLDYVFGQEMFIVDVS